jgi:N-acetylmuramoyl-L-alanine amidase
MPNVLIETGFISNPKEESLLKSESGQSNYAKGILEAIKKYKAIYERS